MPIATQDDACDVTIAVLTRNPGPFLARQLRAVETQITQRRFEFLAIDSGSTDGTVAYLQGAWARCVTIPPESFDFGLTRDLAFEQARGDVVVSMSQDAIPAHAHWLEQLIAPLDEPGVGASCGRSLPDPDRADRQFAWERNGRFYFTREMRRYAARYGRGLSNANSAIPRDLGRRLGFGPQPIGEDYRFQMRLHEAGLRVAFPDDAPVLHHHDYTWNALAKRCRNEGFGLRVMGFPYSAWDCIRDAANPRIWRMWLRDFVKARLRTPAEFAFPVVRPVAVYRGSRFSREFVR